MKGKPSCLNQHQVVKWSLVFGSFKQPNFNYILKINGVDQSIDTQSVQSNDFGHHLAVTFDQEKNLWSISRSHLESELVYFSSANNRLVISNDVVHMRLLADVHQLNEKWLLNFFSFTDSYTYESPFKGISILPALGKMVVSCNGYEIKRHFLSENDINTEGAQEWSVDEWVKKWQSCNQQAIASSSRQSDSIAIMLSSGLDSSGIAAYLKDQLKTSSQLKRVKGFSWSFPNNAKADETIYIQALVDHLGLDHEFIDIEDAHCFADIETWPVSIEAPYFNAMRRIKQILYQAVSQQGFDVLFNGHIGDELCFVDRYVLAELWRDNKSAWVKEFFNILTQTGLNIRYNNSFRYCVKQWFNIKDRGFSAPSSFSENATALFQKYDLGKTNSIDMRPEQLGLLTANSELLAIATEHTFTNEHAIKRCQPYLNRDLIELALSCPAYFLSTHKQTKWISRQALSCLLPATLLNRSRVGQLDELFEQGLDKNVDSIKEYLFRSDRRWPEYINEGAVNEVLDQQQWSKAASVIVPCLGFERWLDEWRSIDMPVL